MLYNPGNQAIPPNGTLGFPSSDYSEFGFIGAFFSLIYIRAKFYARKKFIFFFGEGNHNCNLSFREAGTRTIRLSRSTKA
jgi:hypothetical protein